MNQVDTGCPVIHRRAIRRLVDAWNAKTYCFVWVKTADQILARAKPHLLLTPLCTGVPLRYCDAPVGLRHLAGEDGKSVSHLVNLICGDTK